MTAYDEQTKAARIALTVYLEQHDEPQPLIDLLEALCPTRPYELPAVSRAFTEMLTEGHLILTGDRRVELAP